MISLGLTRGHVHYFPLRKVGNVLRLTECKIRMFAFKSRATERAVRVASSELGVRVRRQTWLLNADAWAWPSEPLQCRTQHPGSPSFTFPTARAMVLVTFLATPGFHSSSVLRPSFCPFTGGTHFLAFLLIFPPETTSDSRMWRLSLPLQAFPLGHASLYGDFFCKVNGLKPAHF